MRTNLATPWFVVLAISTPIWSKFIDKLEPCTDNTCGNMSYDEILRVYRGILLTLSEIEELHRLRRETWFNQSKHQTNLYKPMNDNRILLGDGDSCCPTDVVFSLNYTMLNINGEPKSVIHMPSAIPPRYQYIPHGKCVGYGGCTGTCVVEPTLLTLLVLDGDALGFDFFQVPGYCSCKNF